MGVLRIVVLGAESSGTTTVSLALRDALRARGGVHAATGWVEEYGRRYTLEKLAAVRVAAQRAGSRLPGMADLAWHSEEFTTIARMQNTLAAQVAATSDPLLVCDTDAFATGVWHERYLGTPSPAVDALAEAARGDLYLLTDHRGVAFEADDIRDGEALRAWMTGRFAALLAATGRRHVMLAGSREERLRDALAAVDALVAEGGRPPADAAGTTGR